MQFSAIKKDCLISLGIPVYGSMENYSFREECRDLLPQINNAILRAYDRMIAMGVVPVRETLLPEVSEKGRGNYSISALCGTGEYIGVFTNDEGVERGMKVSRAGDSITLERKPMDGAFVRFYLGLGNPETEEETPLPAPLCRLIPYFCKSELWAEEEPSMAAQARSLFEQSLREYVPEGSEHGSHFYIKYEAK